MDRLPIPAVKSVVPCAMPDDINMSTAGPEDGQGPVARPAPRVKRWSFWRLLGWAVLTLVMLVIVAAAYVWSNRYSFLEDVFIGALAEQGIEADISISHIDRAGAVLEDVDLRSGGVSVFSVGRLTAEYEWRDALGGTVKKLELIDPKLTLTVDESGNIIDGWLPATNASGAGTALPENGIIFKNADVTVNSPYGTVNAAGDVAVKTIDDIRGNFTVKETTLKHDDVTATLSGEVDLIRSGPTWTADIKADIPRAALGNRRMAGALITGVLRFDEGEYPVITGPINLRFDSAVTQRFTIGKGQINWDGSTAIDTVLRRPATAQGQWEAALNGAMMTDAAQADALAATLTLFDTLSAAPVTESFAGGLRGDVRAVMGGSDVAGQGDITWRENAATVRLAAPLTVQSARTNITVSPAGDAPLYAFNADNTRIDIRGGVTLRGQYPVSVSGLSAELSSRDGISFDGLNAASGQLRRAQPWRAKSAGRDVRLAPASIDMRYQGDIDGAGKRRLTLSGPIDFDGPVPGGFASALQAAGALDVTLGLGTLKADFTPRLGSRVTLARFETLTDWTAHDTAFDLLPYDAPLFVRSPGGSRLQAKAGQVSGTLIEAETNRTLVLDVGGVTAEGRIGEGRQDWDMSLTDMTINTDDILGPGAVITAPTADLTAVLTPDNPTQITVSAAAGTVETPQFLISDMPVDLRGTSEVFTADYGAERLTAQLKQGRVRMKADSTLPVLPIKGTLDYNKGVMTGRAKTVLPKAEGTDIDIDFAYQNGIGTADVTVPNLYFMRGALQPQDLVPSLQGKIADVNGAVSAAVNLAFETGQPLSSSGRVTIDDLNFGTLPGPFSGVSTQIDFDSFFPLTTSGQQTLRVESFNPGLALNDGVIKYELVDGGIKIDSAVWPLAGGELSIDPVVWRYDAPKNQVIVRIDGVSIDAFLNKVGGGNLSATGDVEGTIPVTIAGVNVSINDGLLRVKDGGVIQYRSNDLKSVVDLIPEEYVTLEDYQQFQKVRKDKDLGENVGKDLAFTALRNFEYKSLTAKLNGPLDGEVAVNLQFEGRNPKILAGTAFDFDINVVGELVNLIRGLKVDSGMERLKGYIDMGADDAENSAGAPEDATMPLAIESRSSQIQPKKDIRP